MLSAADRPGQLVGPDGESVDIPPSVYQGLRLVAQAIATGQAVTVAPQDLELTTQQAADLLHVSRPHLIKLLDQGGLPFHRTSEDPAAHRRIMLRDLMTYRERRQRDRRESLRELTRASQAAEGGYR
ncbi:MAG: excisionase family DNA-binding protein [Nocardioidaceae bacterium]